MDLRDLHYFETIATLEHVGRAATRLHRTQPALTSAVRRLEDECGAPLFERRGRGIRLTAAGHVLLGWAQRLRVDVEDARREMAEIDQGRSGVVRIGVVPTAAQFLLPPATKRLLSEAPEAAIKTTVALVDALRPLLLAGEIDLMVGTETSTAAGVESILLTEDAIVVAAHADHEVLRAKPSMRALTKYRWVLQPPGAPTRDWLDHAFDRYGLPRPRVQVESSMLVTMPAMIVETGLLSFVSRRHLDDPGRRNPLREVPLRQTTMLRRMVVSYRPHGYLSPLARRMIELLVSTSGSFQSRRPTASR